MIQIHVTIKRKLFKNKHNFCSNMLLLLTIVFFFVFFCCFLFVGVLKIWKEDFVSKAIPLSSVLWPTRSVRWCISLKARHSSTGTLLILLILLCLAHFCSATLVGVYTKWQQTGVRTIKTRRLVQIPVFSPLLFFCKRYTHAGSNWRLQYKFWQNYFSICLCRCFYFWLGT